MGSRRPSIQALRVVLLVALVILFLLAVNPARSLLSLVKVDDHPLYVMHYQGTYFLDQYLKRGVDSWLHRALVRSSPPAGCTTFSAQTTQGEVLMGRNFDYRPHAALLLYTDPPDGFNSVSMIDVHYLGYPEGHDSLAGRLKLLIAPYLTIDGMNEHGLAASIMAVPCREGPSDPSKTTLVSNAVLRLVLDGAQDVDHAIELIERYNVAFPQTCTHYLLADASGHSAVVEYIWGEVRVLEPADRWQVASNFLLSENQLGGSASPCWRYNWAYRTLESADGRLSMGEAMALLGDVAQETTVWSAVYNLDSGEVRVAMGRDYHRLYAFRLPMRRN